MDQHGEHGLWLVSQKYALVCAKLGVGVDPSISVALQTGWSVLAPARAGENALAPLLGLHASERSRFTKLVLRPCRSASPLGVAAELRALSQLLRCGSSSFETLDLSMCALDDEAVSELGAALECNASVRCVDLRGNDFGGAGCLALVGAVRRGLQRGGCKLSSLDLQFNGLPAAAVAEAASLAPHIQVDVFTGNFGPEEQLNAITHGVGAVLAVVATAPLLDACGEDSACFWACALYSATLVFCLGSSAAYHSSFRTERLYRLLQRADHAAIYLLIAGSYTPLLGIGMRAHSMASLIVAVNWTVALAGCLASAAGLGLSTEHINYPELIAYAGMGLALVPISSEIADEFETTAWLLVLGGGAFYLGGIVFFVLGAKTPIYHIVWHLCVLAAAAAHWFCVFLFVAPAAAAAAATAALPSCRPD